MEQTYTEMINREKEENDKYKNKLFVMDNALHKKDGIIFSLKRKIERLSEDERYQQYYDREIYVIEPTKANTQIHDELLMYKQIYDTLVINIKEKGESLMRYEQVINELQNENSKMRTQNKLQTISLNRERELNKERAKLERDENCRALTHNDLNYGANKQFASDGKNSEDVQLAVNITKLKDKLAYTNSPGMEGMKVRESRKCVRSQSEEWHEILRLSGVTSEELDRLAKNKTMARIVEAIEMMNRLLCDKNLQINLIEQENENLNKKNITLNKENIALFQELMEFKKDFQKMANARRKNIETTSDSSMVSKLI